MKGFILRGRGVRWVGGKGEEEEGGGGYLLLVEVND